MKLFKVLMVEDNEDWAEMLRSLLKKVNVAELAGREYDEMKITPAANQSEANEALAAAGAGGYDLILLDLQYPAGNEPHPDVEHDNYQGMTWLPELRKLQPNATIIILTSHNDPHNVLSAIRDYHANDFISKTESFDNILARIRVAWGNTKRMRQTLALETEFRSLVRSRAARTYAEDIAAILNRTKNSMHIIARRIESGDRSAIATAADDIRNEFNFLNNDFIELTNMLNEGVESCRPVDVAALVRELVLLYQRMIDNAQAESVTPGETESVVLTTFAGDLKVALHEVIYNALYALEHSGRSPRERELVIAVEEREGGAVIKVMDNADGFTNEAMQRMFERGFSTKKSQGLGLYIARRMMEQSGGSITARERPGGGAEVELSVKNLAKP